MRQRLRRALRLLRVLEPQRLRRPRRRCPMVLLLRARLRRLRRRCPIVLLLRARLLCAPLLLACARLLLRV